MSTLIERLEALANETVKLHAAQIMTVREAITALSPILPDDVARWVERLRKYAPLSRNADDALLADLLERQALAIAAHQRMYERLNEADGETIAALEQRIEELEAPTLPDDVARVIGNVNSCSSQNWVQPLPNQGRHWGGSLQSNQSRVNNDIPQSSTQPSLGKPCPD